MILKFETISGLMVSLAVFYQVVFVPDKDYVSSASSTPAMSPTAEPGESTFPELTTTTESKGKGGKEGDTPLKVDSPKPTFVSDHNVQKPGKTPGVFSMQNLLWGHHDGTK